MSILFLNLYLYFCATFLPFHNDEFDIVINRHGNYVPAELHRILKPGGIFITEQVGEDNERDLVELLLPGMPKPFRFGAVFF